MKLGEIAHVSRGIATGNRNLFVMTRREAVQRGLAAFTRPIINGTREIPKENRATIYDHAERLVVLIASARDVKDNPVLRKYLGEVLPRFSSVPSAPIVATYVGVPRFAANPDNLVALNSLYRVTPKRELRSLEILELVHRFNRAAESWAKAHALSRFSPSKLEAMEI